uniref:Uncharacterized protein n=1 Tax=Steinernema glaseri TaxID=37863 RepID=A0A1I7ZS92_9BILA
MHHALETLTLNRSIQVVPGSIGSTSYMVNLLIRERKFLPLLKQTTPADVIEQTLILLTRRIQRCYPSAQKERVQLVLHRMEECYLHKIPTSIDVTFMEMKFGDVTELRRTLPEYNSIFPRMFTGYECAKEEHYFDTPLTQSDFDNSSERWTPFSDHEITVMNNVVLHHLPPEVDRHVRLVSVKERVIHVRDAATSTVGDHEMFGSNPQRIVEEQMKDIFRYFYHQMSTQETEQTLVQLVNKVIHEMREEIDVATEQFLARWGTTGRIKLSTIPEECESSVGLSCQNVVLNFRHPD